jgi:hypothetical protein
MTTLSQAPVVTVARGPVKIVPVRRLARWTAEDLALLVMATVWYVLVISVLPLGQHRVERHYCRSTR